MGERLCHLIHRRVLELRLDPPTFVFSRFGGENITRTYDYLKGFDSDVEKHPIPEPTCRDLAGALEVPYKQVRDAASESYKRLSEGWGSGLVPHANIVLHPYDGPLMRGWGASLMRVNTRIDFIPGSPPDTFVDQAVRGLRRRDLKAAQVSQPRRQLRMGHGGEG